MIDIQPEWQAAFDVLHLLEEAGYEAVIVGGAVRDFLRHHEANDVDVATNAVPEEVKAIFARTADVGIAHGTVLVLHPISPVEVTTFRTEGTYQDHRRPDQVAFVTSLEEDLQRRDFTINAMAMRENQQIVDLYGGRKDLSNHLIRAVGDPQQRFSEDALRMLRAIRFSAQLGYTIEPNTFDAIHEKKTDIRFIAKERIKAEFDKIWLSEYPEKAIQYINDTGLADYLPGDYPNATAWKRFRSHHHASNGWAFFILLQGMDQTNRLLQEFKCSNKEKVYVKNVLQAYKKLMTTGWSKRDYFDFDEDVLQTAFDFSGYLNQSAHGILDLKQITAEKKSLAIQSRHDVVVTGHDFLQWSGRKKGPWLKETIEKMIEAILAEQLSNDQQKIKDWFMRECNSET